MFAIQYLDTARDQAEADQMLAACAIQVDYLAGRVLPPVNQQGKNTWRVQVMFEDVPEVAWLPDCCTRRYVPRGFLCLNSD